ncbi:MAG: HAD family hydrolase [Lachnospiraceae bacterium]|nr:HAD family hydrolase [Lachnospiraceae bacterium]
MKYRLAIFDLDGTILDTLEDLTASTNAALAANALPGRNLEEVRAFVGNGIRNLIEKAVPTGTLPAMTDRVFEDFKTHYAVHCADRTCPYPGIPELIRKIREAGMKTAVVSNKGDFAVQSLCRDYFEGLLDFAVGEREGIRRKPAPDSVFECLRHFDLQVEDAVYIGDSEVDASTAANAGMDLIAVTWGFRSEEVLQGSGAKVLAHEAAQLEKLLLGE